MNIKKASLLATAGLILAGMGGAANAVPTVWTDTVDVPWWNQYVADGISYVTYTQDITDGAGGYRPGVDSLTKLVFNFSVTDDLLDIPWFEPTGEAGVFTIDAIGDAGSLTKTFKSLSDTSNPIEITSNVAWDSGKYQVTISSTYGDFLVKGSTLTATGDRASSVPEPATLTLMGLGLLGVGAAGRRKKRQ